MRRFRVWFANVPVLSLLTLWRWQALYGSEVVDYARSRHTAERRARAFIREGGWTVQKWNATTIERVRAFGGRERDSTAES